MWIGLISYSLYLWHWVVIVWANHLADPSGWIGPTVLMALSVLLAVASYQLVEKPMRYGTLYGRFMTKPTRVLISVAAYGVLIVVAISLLMNSTRIFRVLHGGNSISVALAAPESQSMRTLVGPQGRCYNRSLNDVCTFMAFDEGPSDTLFIAAGDSFMDMQTFKVLELAQAHGADLKIDAISGCPMLLDFEIISQPDHLQSVMQNCNSISDHRLNTYHGWASDYQKVVVFWAIGNHYLVFDQNYLHADGTLDLPSNVIRTLDALGQVGSQTVNAATNSTRTAVIAFTPFPQPPVHLTNYVQEQTREQGLDQMSQLAVERTTAQAGEVMAPVRTALLALDDTPSRLVINTMDSFCDTKVCSFHDDQHLWFYDTGHLSMAGSIKIYDDNSVKISRFLDQ